MRKILMLIVVFLFSLTACSQTSEKSPTQEQPESPVDITNPLIKSPEPTKTEVRPTDTPIPTITTTFSPDTLSFAPGEPLNVGYLFMETHPFGIDSTRGAEIDISDFGSEIYGHPIELTGFDAECNELAAPDSRSTSDFRTAPNDIFQVKAVDQYASNQLGLGGWRLSMLPVINSRSCKAVPSAMCLQN